MLHTNIATQTKYRLHKQKLRPLGPPPPPPTLVPPQAKTKPARPGPSLRAQAASFLSVCFACPVAPRRAGPDAVRTPVVIDPDKCLLPLSFHLPVKSESEINVQLQQPRNSESYEKHLAVEPVGTRNPGKDWLILFCSESSESECFSLRALDGNHLCVLHD